MAPPMHPSHVHAFDRDFVTRVLDDALAHGARVYGISGLQGSGKSTLAAQLAGAAADRGLRLASVSIDDFYLDLDERQHLARQVHPLLATRGPPGTHDISFAAGTLDALRRRGTVRLPRFDKASDRRLPCEQWPTLGQADLVVLEGWFLATPPEAEEALATPINTLERDEDPDGRWRRWCNQALACDYPSLWRRIDRLLFLQPPGFEVVPDWRWQQEQTLSQADPQRRGMDRAALERFVQHFERVSRQALRTLPAIADLTVRLDARRRPAWPE
ncbi:kinase [Luteimonas sp. A277]